MKSKLTVLAMTLIWLSAFGQNPADNNDAKVKWGIKLGLTISNIKLDDNSGLLGSPTTNSKAGFLAGGYSRIMLGRSASFQPEVLLAVKGWKETGSYGSYPHKATYLEFPFSLLYTSTRAKGVFFIGGGPAPAIYIGETVFFNGYNDYRQFDIGVHVLMGYEVPIGVSLNLHYTHGLADVNSYDNGVSIKNRSFGLSVGYTF